MLMIRGRLSAWRIGSMQSLLVSLPLNCMLSRYFTLIIKILHRIYTTHKKLRTVCTHIHVSQTRKAKKFKFGIHFIQCFRNHCATFHLYWQIEFWCTVHQTEYGWNVSSQSLHLKNRTLKVSFQLNDACIHHCLRDTHCSDSSWSWRGL